ncbi:MAG TPA: FAD-dependent monooxygenase [Thermoanaerobaculia bacterium]|nr:FAD-dependent monooxygenase [Thermoanaerobaculia bacterium]
MKVAIVGAGPAGCAAAIALAQRGISACIVERADATEPRPGEMLQPSSAQLLAQLGVDVSGHRRAFGVASAWESEDVTHNDFFSGASGDGWLLDRAQFDRALRDAAREQGVVTSTHADARFVIDATGIAATIARQRGAKRIAYDQLAGVFATVDGHGDGFTLVEAAEHGWWYSAFAPGGRVVIAFMSDADILREQHLHERDPWLAALHATRHTRGRAGAAIPDALHVRSAASAILGPLSGDDWLAAGDAASVWDPLSSSGIHKALQNGIAAADAIARNDVDRYARGVRAEFDEYLVMRDRYYSLVQSWPESRFWQRRQTAITLDPMATVQTRDGLRMDRIDPRLRIDAIVAFCREPRRAHEVVAACADHDDRVVILAMQAMLRERVLAMA